MIRWIRSYLVDFTCLLAIGMAFYFIKISQIVGTKLYLQLPDSLLQLNTIFLSILIEAFPFVLVGVLIAGFIQIFVTEDYIRRLIPKNRFLAVTMSCIVGAAFPACECGIVPIVRRLISKGVPIHAGIGFLLTGPLINPIVILSTYMAFGNDMKMAGLRMGVGFVAAFIITLIISFLFKSNQLKHSDSDFTSSTDYPKKKEPFIHRVEGMLKHSIDEFFDMGKYLILGAFIAAGVFILFFCIQLFRIWEKEEDSHVHCSPGCTHDHGDSGSLSKTLMSYGILIFPLLTGFAFAPTVLDSTIAAKKGTILPQINRNDNNGIGESLSENNLTGIHEEQEVVPNNNFFSEEKYNQEMEILEESEVIQMNDGIYSSYY